VRAAHLMLPFAHGSLCWTIDANVECPSMPRILTMPHRHHDAQDAPSAES
jgi:hypothetical protein